MTADSVDLIRNAYEAYLDGDIAAIADLVDPDLEWTFLDPSEEDPTPQLCHGSEQLIYWMTRRFNQGQRATVEEVAGYGDRVLVVTRITESDELSSLSTDRLRYHVVTVEGGRIIALRACRNQSEAIEFAGGNGR